MKRTHRWIDTMPSVSPIMKQAKYSPGTTSAPGRQATEKECEPSEVDMAPGGKSVGWGLTCRSYPLDSVAEKFREEEQPTAVDTLRMASGRSIAMDGDLTLMKNERMLVAQFAFDLERARSLTVYKIPESDGRGLNVIDLEAIAPF